MVIATPIGAENAAGAVRTKRVNTTAANNRERTDEMICIVLPFARYPSLARYGFAAAGCVDWAMTARTEQSLRAANGSENRLTT